MAVAAKGVYPGIEVLGVQSERFPAMSQLMRRQTVQCDRYTVAEGIAVRNPGQLTREVVREHVSDVLLVGEDESESSVLMLLQVEKTVVEGAGAGGLAALLKNRKRFKPKKVGLVLSGGNIMEVHHQRAFSAQPLQTALVDFTLQTRGREHLDQILGVIKTAGLRASLPDPDVRSSRRNGHNSICQK